FEHDAQPMTFLSRLTLAWGSKPDTPASSSEGSTSKTLQELTPFKPAVRSETLPGASLSGLSAESVNAVFTALVRDPLFQFLSSHDTEGPRPLAEPTVKPMQEALHDYVNLQSSTPKVPATATWQSGSAGPSATTAQQQQQQQQQGVSSRNSVSSSQSSFSEQDALLAFANLGSGSTSRPTCHYKPPLFIPPLSLPPATAITHQAADWLF
ncbi:hypothetical protein QJQ45_025900, partial [Haematococcus lacustris]